MKLEFIIIKSLTVYDNYIRYGSYLDSKYIKDHYPEVFKIFLTLLEFYKQNSRDISCQELATLFYANYPAANPNEYNFIFEELEKVEISDSMPALLETLAHKIKGTIIAETAIKFVQGKGSFTELEQVWEDVPSTSPVEDYKFVTTDLAELHQAQRARPGLRWRLDSLNKMCGSLRKGDLAIIFARPNAGKTTFLANEVAGFLGQTDRPILWVNNEESGEKPVLRVFQSMFSVNLPTLYGNIGHYNQEFERLGGNRLKLYDDAGITKAKIEEICKTLQPGCVLLDQIDKIRGFTDDRRDLELTAVYQWARELAKLYCPVIGVCQASATAEGKQWLTMNDMDGSKVGKQGEADLIIGIGQSHDLERVRFVHVCKNKLHGDEDTDPSRRHGFQQVLLKADIARYEDI
jgi:KaiC/GvpD/RAD55 family RecA-like ATPase